MNADDPVRPMVRVVAESRREGVSAVAVMSVSRGGARASGPASPEDQGRALLPGRAPGGALVRLSAQVIRLLRVRRDQGDTGIVKRLYGGTYLIAERYGIVDRFLSGGAGLGQPVGVGDAHA